MHAPMCVPVHVHMLVRMCGGHNKMPIVVFTRPRVYLVTQGLSLDPESHGLSNSS